MFLGKLRCLIRCGIPRVLVLKRDQTLQDSGKRTRAYQVDGMIDGFQTRSSYQDHRRDDQTACVLGHIHALTPGLLIITCIS
jgi:hypothetical protein